MLKFLKTDPISNTLIFFKILHFITIRGSAVVPDPQRGPVIAFKCPLRKHPGYASGNIFAAKSSILIKYFFREQFN